MALETTAPGSLGILGSLRQLFDTVLGALQLRLELVASELREEKSRAVSILIWSALVVFLSFMAMIAITFLVVVLFWEQAVWVLAGFSVFYVASAFAAWLAIRRSINKPIFPETINQLKKDRAWLLPGK